LVWSGFEMFCYGNRLEVAGDGFIRRTGYGIEAYLIEGSLHCEAFTIFDLGQRLQRLRSIAMWPVCRECLRNRTTQIKCGMRA